LRQKNDSHKVMQYIRNHPDLLNAMTAKSDEIRANSNRNERAKIFKELLETVKAGENSRIRSMREADPQLVEDVAAIFESDRLFNFQVMLSCASEGNAVYMKFLAKQFPYLVNYQNDYGESVFFNTIQSRDLDTVKALSNADFNIMDSSGRRALHVCCAQCMKSLAHYLIFNGANVNVQDRNGETPMHYVCSAKKPSSTIMKMLVGNGARLDIEDQTHRTCIDILKGNGHHDLAHFIKSFEVSESKRIPQIIKNEKEKRQDIFCFKHKSYCCPCAVLKKELAQHSC